MFKYALYYSETATATKPVWDRDGKDKKNKSSFNLLCYIKTKNHFTYGLIGKVIEKQRKIMVLAIKNISQSEKIKEGFYVAKEALPVLLEHGEFYKISQRMYRNNKYEFIIKRIA